MSDGQSSFVLLWLIYKHLVSSRDVGGSLVSCRCRRKGSGESPYGSLDLTARSLPACLLGDGPCRSLANLLTPVL